MARGTRHTGLHARVERAKLLREFWGALRGANKCDNCGAAQRKIRKDGATKLFQQPRVQPAPLLLE